MKRFGSQDLLSNTVSVISQVPPLIKKSTVTFASTGFFEAKENIWRRENNWVEFSMKSPISFWGCSRQ